MCVWGGGGRWRVTLNKKALHNHCCTFILIDRATCVNLTEHEIGDRCWAGGPLGLNE